MVVGLTGGIGSGKSTVASFFRELGIPVYDADSAAKHLMVTSKGLKTEIVKLLGTEAYQGSLLNRAFIADKIFSNNSLLQKMNAIVHPAVADDFMNWKALQDAPYVVKEAAILIENGTFSKCDFLILVRAPLKLRLERVMKRDQTDRETVLKRINAQWSDDKKAAYADVVIDNIQRSNTEQEVQRIHTHLLRKLRLAD